MVQNPPANARDMRDLGSVGREDPLEKRMETYSYSSILDWRISGTEEPGGLQSVGSQRVSHDCSDLACMPAYK